MCLGFECRELDLESSLNVLVFFSIALNETNQFEFVLIFHGVD